MKWIVFTVFALFSYVSIAQVSDIEQRLNDSEQTLIELQQEQVERKQELSERGIQFKDDFTYIELTQQVKTQKKKVKILRKQFNAYKKEQAKLQKIKEQEMKAQQSVAQPVITPNSPPTSELTKEQIKINKQTLKTLKSEVKQLQKDRKIAISEAMGRQENPANSQLVQSIDSKIYEKLNQIQAIQNGTAPAPQTTTNTTAQQVSKGDQTVDDKQGNVSKGIPEIALSTILYPKFSTEFNEEYALYLNVVAKQMLEHPELVLAIEAFTDNSEKNKVNAQLTSKMANHVAQAFVNRGIPAERLIVKAKGSKQPVGDNNTFFGQVRNRRVELSFQ